MQLNVVLTLIFAIIISAFAIFNASVVTVSFFFAKVDLSLAIVIIGSALIGALVIWFFDAFKKMKTKKQIKDLNKRNTELEKQVTQKESYAKELETKLAVKEELIKELKLKDETNTNTNTNTNVQNTNLENGE